MKKMRNSNSNSHSLKNERWGYSAYHLLTRKILSKRKGVRKKDLKQWHPEEIRDWNIE